jgi:hypothetical protein
MRKYIISSLLLSVAFFAKADEQKQVKSADVDSPFGICAHLSHGEYPEAEVSMKMLNEAGIGFVRTGFPWGRIEAKQGEFDYTRWDNLMKYAQENCITISANFPS